MDKLCMVSHNYAITRRHSNVFEAENNSYKITYEAYHSYGSMAQNIISVKNKSSNICYRNTRYTNKFIDVIREITKDLHENGFF